MGIKVVANNKKASYDYFIEDTLECGIELRGTEIKSIRNGSCNIKDSWCNIINGELYINSMYIAKYENGSVFNHEETRVRKLLAHRREIINLGTGIKQKGYTLIPLKVYINDKGKAKVLIGLCRGKHTYDKRQALKDRDAKLNIERSLKY